MGCIINSSRIRRISLKVGLAFAALLTVLYIVNGSTKNTLPIVAVASYGPDNTLDRSILGLKAALSEQGFRENDKIRYEISNANFEPTLIEQMLTKLKAKKPAVMVVITTPVAQNAKNMIKDIPLVYSVITDPLVAGLLVDPNQSYQNITGSSDKQNLNIFLRFTQKILPEVKSVGLLYSNSEANDAAVLEMMQTACKAANLTLVPVAIDHPRDIPFRMQAFKNKVDLIYLAGSNTIQPAIPAITACADKLQLPIFSVGSDEVKHNLVFGSFGVDYFQVGARAGQIVAKILKGQKVAEIPPVYPQEEDYHGYISQLRANKLSMTIPSSLENITVVE